MFSEPKIEELVAIAALPTKAERLAAFHKLAVHRELEDAQKGLDAMRLMVAEFRKSLESVPDLPRQLNPFRN